jgi:hypothetical protein
MIPLARRFLIGWPKATGSGSIRGPLCWDACAAPFCCCSWGLVDGVTGEAAGEDIKGDGLPFISSFRQQVRLIRLTISHRGLQGLFESELSLEVYDAVRLFNARQHVGLTGQHFQHCLLAAFYHEPIPGPH